MFYPRSLIQFLIHIFWIIWKLISFFLSICITLFSASWRFSFLSVWYIFFCWWTHDEFRAILLVISNDLDRVWMGHWFLLFLPILCLRLNYSILPFVDRWLLFPSLEIVCFSGYHFIFNSIPTSYFSFIFFCLELRTRPY